MPEGACPDLLILPLYAAMPLELQVCCLSALSLSAPCLNPSFRIASSIQSCTPAKFWNCCSVRQPWHLQKVYMNILSALLAC